jgi:hypothetical protein
MKYFLSEELILKSSLPDHALSFIIGKNERGVIRRGDE